MLISSRTQAAFADVSGWQTYAIGAEGSGESALKDFSGLTIGGRLQIDNAKSQLVRDLQPGNGARWRGLFPDMTSWSGHDLCLAADSVVIICTRKVREVAEQFGLTNIEFVPVAEASNNLIRPYAWELSPSADPDDTAVVKN